MYPCWVINRSADLFMDGYTSEQMYVDKSTWMIELIGSLS
jgi:hypothetical protein